MTMETTKLISLSVTCRGVDRSLLVILVPRIPLSIWTGKLKVVRRATRIAASIADPRVGRRLAVVILVLTGSGRRWRPTPK